MGKGSSSSSSSSQQQDYRTGGDNGAITAGVDSTQTINYTEIDDGLVDFGGKSIDLIENVITQVLKSASAAIETNFEQGSKLIDLTNKNTEATLASLDDDKGGDIGVILAQAAVPALLLGSVAYVAFKYK